MSTEHQQYSLANQAAAIDRYAAQRGFVLVRSYVDRGISGLSLAGRLSLRQLIHDICSGSADFEAVLIYDISRWGRFQDTDESAHYEFMCRQMGVSLHYCAEQFDNDGSISAALLKSIKRVMAAEFSRELSAKVYAGHVRVARQGYMTQGMAPLGFSKQLVSRTGMPKGILQRGERKNIHSDRVILVPGPEQQVKLVRRIFEIYVMEGKGEKKIADELNRLKISTVSGALWLPSTVAAILSNEAYIGTLVYGRKRRINMGPRVKVPPETWLRVEDAFEPIIPKDLFAAAQDIRRHRQTRKELSDEELLARLKRLFDRHGRLTQELINADPEALSTTTYRSRFGSMQQAFAAIGYDRIPPGPQTPPRKYLRFRLLKEVISELRARDIAVTRQFSLHLLTVEEAFTLSVITARRRGQIFGRFGSRRLKEGSPTDVTLVVRANIWDESLFDYYLLGGPVTLPHPRSPPRVEHIARAEHRRIVDLDPLFDFARSAAAAR